MTALGSAPTRALSLLVAVAAFPVVACTAASVFVDGAFPLALSAFENAQLRACPCATPSLCLPVALVAPTAASEVEEKKEVFALSVTTDDRWKQYDWDRVTTIAWNVDPELLCHAHSRGVKVVVKHNFDDTATICDATARRAWVKQTYESIVTRHADGVNIDTEKPLMGEAATCQTQLVRELRNELRRHPLTAKAQITFDAPWAPRPIDGRFYEWKQLSELVDFFFVMAYDMRSQVYYQCLAAANSPRALVEQGLREFIHAHGIAPHKLVLGVPWYGYKYPCESWSEAQSLCVIAAQPFFDAPCSDAAGSQIDYGKIQKLAASLPARARRWDKLTQSPFLEYEDLATRRATQLWFDDEQSLRLKYALVKTLGLRGAGMWNADTLDYAGDGDGARRMWHALDAIY